MKHTSTASSRRTPVTKRTIATSSTTTTSYTITLTRMLITRSRTCNRTRYITIALHTALAALQIPIILGALVTKLPNHVRQAFTVTELVVTLLWRVRISSVRVTITF